VGAASAGPGAEMAANSFGAFEVQLCAPNATGFCQNGTHTGLQNSSSRDLLLLKHKVNLNSELRNQLIINLSALTLLKQTTYKNTAQQSPWSFETPETIS